MGRFGKDFQGILASLSAVCLAAIVLTFVPAVIAEQASPSARQEQKWTNSLSSDPGFFPLALWLQAPANAERYRQAGFNLYVGFWQGQNEEQLAALKQAGMRVICGQNEAALRHRDDSTILGWMHGDEPDNAQSLGEGRGWGAPVLPEKIVADYQKLQAADPTRPVLLNLGQGVAWDGW